MMSGEQKMGARVVGMRGGALGRPPSYDPSRLLFEQSPLQFAVATDAEVSVSAPAAQSEVATGARRRLSKGRPARLERREHPPQQPVSPEQHQRRGRREEDAEGDERELEWGMLAQWQLRL